MWAESCVPTGMLDDSIVSLVTDSRRLRKWGIGSDAWERPRKRRSSRSIRVELQQELAHRGERRMLSLKSNGYVNGLVKEFVRDPGCGVLPVRAVFRDTYKLKKELFLAVEGTCMGQVWEILQVDLMAPVAKILMD